MSKHTEDTQNPEGDKTETDLEKNFREFLEKRKEQLTKVASLPPLEPVPGIVRMHEILEVSKILSKHHGLFRTFWDMGSPTFVDDQIHMPTAAIAFDSKSGEPVKFMWNERFWRGLDTYTRAFIAAHEMLHVIFKHGRRMLDHKDDPRNNIAMDISINECLVNSFGFDRSLICQYELLTPDGESVVKMGPDDGCWVDTVFPTEDVICDETGDVLREGNPEWAGMPGDRNYEFYYNRMDEPTVIKIIKGGGGQTMDEHGMSDEDMEAVKEYLDGCGMREEIEQAIRDEKSGSLKEELKKHTPKNEAPDREGSDKARKAGTNAGSYIYYKRPTAKAMKKWEHVIPKWTTYQMVETTRDVENFVMPSRRMDSFLSSNPDLMLPTVSEMPVKDLVKSCIEVWLFLDTSGSCISYKDRFIQASVTLDEFRFKVRTFSFDTQCEEVEIDKIHGGGGTCFQCVEDKIQSVCKDEGVKYPPAVFIITDGEAGRFTTEFPERWCWFMTDHFSNDVVPKESKIFELKDFE